MTSIEQRTSEKLWNAYSQGELGGHSHSKLTFSVGYSDLAEASLDADVNDEPELLPVSVEKTAEGFLYTGVADYFIRRAQDVSAKVCSHRVYAEILADDLKMRIWIADNDGRVEVILPVAEDMIDAMWAVVNGAPGGWMLWDPRIAKTTVYLRRPQGVLRSRPGLPG